MTLFKLRRLPYYISSLYKLAQDLKKPGLGGLLYFIFLRFFKKITLQLTLRKKNLSFKIYSLLDLLVLKEVILDEEYERDLPISKNDRVIVDIGAGFGDFSILSAKKNPQAKIYAFEPDKVYFNLLKENLRLNKCSNILPFKKTVTSLPEIFSWLGKKNIDFLKIDCEGCEYAIFGNVERERVLRG